MARPPGELVEEAGKAALRFLVPGIFLESHQGDGLERVLQGCKELHMFRSLFFFLLT